MATTEELQVLSLLAKEWTYKGPPGILDLSAIITALDQAPSITLEAISSLYQSGLIDMNSLKTAAFLTPEGYTATLE